MRTFWLRKRWLVLTGLVAVIACLAPSAETMATTATSSFSVTISLSATCTVNSTQTLDFGSRGLLAVNFDATADIVVTCTETTPYHVGLDAGAGTGASVAVRKMTGSGSSTVNYTLYSDSGHATVWGTTVSTDTVDAVGTGNAVTHRVYGRVPPQKSPAPDTYSDTITVTVTY
jgi:spore coat protein U-like protein